MICIHSPAGLCESCQREYDADPAAWLEYGDHANGIANTNRLLAELRQEAETYVAPDMSDWPL